MVRNSTLIELNNIKPGANLTELMVFAWYVEERGLKFEKNYAYDFKVQNQEVYYEVKRCGGFTQNQIDFLKEHEDIILYVVRPASDGHRQLMQEQYRFDTLLGQFVVQYIDRIPFLHQLDISLGIIADGVVIPKSHLPCQH